MNIDDFLIDSSNEPEMNFISIKAYLNKELNFDEVVLDNIDCQTKISKAKGTEYRSSETALNFISYSEQSKMQFKLNYLYDYDPKTNTLSVGYKDPLARVLNGLDPNKQWFKFKVENIQELLSHIKQISLVPREYEDNGYTRYTIEVTGVKVE